MANTWRPYINPLVLFSGLDTANLALLPLGDGYETLQLICCSTWLLWNARKPLKRHKADTKMVTMCPALLQNSTQTSSSSDRVDQGRIGRGSG